MARAVKDIVAFNVARNLKTYNDTTEIDMLTEELNEFKDACRDDDTNERLNALCDMVVLAVGAIHKLGYDPGIALSETVREITSRVGAINPDTGKWEKDKNQDPTTLYTPNYENARRP